VFATLLLLEAARSQAFDRPSLKQDIWKV